MSILLGCRAKYRVGLQDASQAQLIAQTDKKDAIRYPSNSFITFDTKFVGILAIWLKNGVASPRHHICPRPLMAFASSNVFTAQSVQHAIKLIEIENMSMNYR